MNPAMATTERPHLVPRFGTGRNARSLKLAHSRYRAEAYPLGVKTNAIMKPFQELGEAVATARRALRLKRKDVAAQTGITSESLLRSERGRVPEFGSKKTSGVLAVLGMERTFVKVGSSGSLDELRRERGGA